MVLSDLLNIKKYIRNYNITRNYSNPIHTTILNENISKRIFLNESQFVENKIPTFHGLKFDNININFDCEIFAAIVLGVSTIAIIKKYT